MERVYQTRQSVNLFDYIQEYTQPYTRPHTTLHQTLHELYTRPYASSHKTTPDYTQDYTRPYTRLHTRPYTQDWIQEISLAETNMETKHLPPEIVAIREYSKPLFREYQAYQRALQVHHM